VHVGTRDFPPTARGFSLVPHGSPSSPVSYRGDVQGLVAESVGVLVPRSNLDRTECWYAHFFRGNELVVAFDDEVFRVSTDPKTWEAAIEHGKARGVPDAQLDFAPRTIEEVEAAFGLRVT
jgi:hypothetical protein